MYAERTPLVFLLLAGCGSLAGGDYRGEVMLRIEGQVLVDDAASLDSSIGVALLWTNGQPSAAELQSVVVGTSFPARYDLKLYRPPPAATRLPLLGVDNLQASIGQIVLYEDRNGDGRWNRRNEPVVGGAYDSAVVWVDDAEAARGALDEVGTDFEAAPDPDTGSFAAPAYGWTEQHTAWTPRLGFQLVDVPVPPACGLPLQEVLFERGDNRATLHVGGLRNAWYDWDCDGDSSYDGWSEYDEPDTGSPPQNGSDWPVVDGDPLEDVLWDTQTCGPAEVLESDCLFLQELLEQGYVDASQNDALFPAFWLTCLQAVCPETIGAYAEALGVD